MEDLVPISPSMAPSDTRTVFQISVPAMVNSRNSPKLSFAMPAGIEIKLRISGTIRQKNTVQYP